MKAYLAIIKDSFREAIVSRVLWVLLVLSALLLLLLSPFQVTETAGSQLIATELRDPQGLFQRIYAGRTSLTKSPEKQVWESMEQRWRDQLQQTAEAGEDDFMASAARFGILVEAINSAIRNPDFYDADAFADFSLPEEANDLIAQGNDLSETQIARRNRLILQTAFSSDISGAAPWQITVSYFGKDFYGPLSGEGYEKTEFVTGWLTWFADYGVGVIGVFCAILATASIIPQTFEQGAIDLLLSKPVNRPLVFLTKYLGGCVFICLVATFCVGGIWLLSGFRWGVWHLPFLMCIPVVTFIFAIYYAVSALAGVIWRNAIVSVIVTVAFWVLCYLVWAFHFFGDSAMAPEALVTVSESEAGLIAVRENRRTVRWDDGDWHQVLSPGDVQQNPLLNLPAPLPIGPTYDAANKRLYQINSPGLFSRTGPKLAYADLAEDGQWVEREGLDAPGGAEELFIHNGELFTVSTQGVSRLDGNPTPPDEQALLWGLVNLPTPGGEKGGTFVSASEPLQISQPFSADVDLQSGKIAVANSKHVVVLALDETGKSYIVERNREMTDEKTRLAAIGGNTILTAQEDSWVRVLNVNDLAERATFKLPGKNTPRFVVASPGGRWFAVITHQKRLWMYDSEKDQPVSPGVSGQGDITAAAFSSDDEILVVDALDAVSTYALPDFSVTETRAPEIEGGRAFMWYGVNPIYTIFPKPGELGDLMRYMVYETADKGESEDLSQQRITLNVWQPVWSNLLFMAVVLGLGSFYIWRKDF